LRTDKWRISRRGEKEEEKTGLTDYYRKQEDEPLIQEGALCLLRGCWTLTDMTLISDRYSGLVCHHTDLDSACSDRVA
jgi:hypothetical protein